MSAFISRSARVAKSVLLIESFRMVFVSFKSVELLLCFSLFVVLHVKGTREAARNDGKREGFLGTASDW